MALWPLLPLRAAQCPAPPEIPEPAAGGGGLGVADVLAAADRVQSTDGVVTLDGNTTIEYQGRTLTAENALYLPEDARVEVDGALRFEGAGLLLESRDARIDLDDNLLSTGASRYELNLGGRFVRGSAEQLRRDSQGRFRLDGATYSACPPEDAAWYIKARRIELRPDKGDGVARDIVLRFKNAPILALPWFSFPISPERKSGFLAPTLGRNDNIGLELQMPWYWNIRPWLDTTFTPRLTTRRGLQLQNELRYMNTLGAWQLDTAWLRDRDRDDMTRTYARLRHQGQLGLQWKTEINAARVSDNDYFKDLGSTLQVASITHLERRAEARYRKPRTAIDVRLMEYQTLDDTITAADRPYRMLPQLAFNTEAPLKPFGLEADFRGEAVYFTRPDSTDGLRMSAVPRLSWPVRRDSWFIQPTLSWHFRHYTLYVDGDEQDRYASGSRDIPMFSIDSGLYLDRRLQDGSLWSVEPRLFYLHVPYVSQERFPLFDTSAFDFNYAQLFRENRFSGGDRIGDGRQLALGVNTRLTRGRDGQEWLRASLGQIRYFDDRRVGLDRDVDLRRDSSDVVGSMQVELNNDWQAAVDLQWNPLNGDTVRSGVLLSWRPDDGRLMNFAHRNVNNDNDADTEQLDFSTLWPIGQDWRLAARWNYSLDANLTIDSLLGLEYDSCCWAMRLAARRYITNEGDSHATGLYLQLVLKGLAPLGQDYGTLLENAILGYRDDYD